MSVFIPRLSTSSPTPMLNNPWWYSNGNIFYASGYGLPNCTCYAYGRYAEIRGAFAALPSGDAGTWYDNATAFERGQAPRLGAIICWHDPTGVYAGHVAVVEEIQNDGTINTSNSAWGGEYFYTAYRSPPDYYIPYHDGAYTFQGFIYLDSQPTPPTPTPTRPKMPVWMMVDYNTF